MLKNSVLTEFIEKQFNSINTNEYYKFKIFNSAGDYEQKGAGANITGIMHNIADGSVRTEMQYMITTCSYEISLALPVSLGLGEIKEVEEIVNTIVIGLNNKPFDLDGGKLLMSFRPQKSGGYASKDKVGRAVEIHIAFGIEFSEVLANGNYYEMALIDNPFDNSTVNTRYFKSQAEQVQWYNDKIEESGIPYNKTFTPNVTSTTITNQVYINDNGLNINDILMKNYAIIREKDKDGNILNHYYYWVESSSIGANNQPLFNLKMDTLQTIYFNPNLLIPQSLVKRGHLNRWIDNGDDTVTFDCTPSSKLFETEGRDTPKRLTRRTKIKLKHTQIDEVNEWLNNYVDYWVYIYVDKSHKYSLCNLETRASATMGDNESKYIQYSFFDKDGGNDAYSADYAVFAYPVMIGDSVIQIDYNAGGDKAFYINKMGYDEFIKKNYNTSYFYNIKTSLVCPFLLTPVADYEIIYDYTQTYSKQLHIKSSQISGSNKTFIDCGSVSNAVMTNIGFGLITGFQQYDMNIFSNEYNIANQYTFNKTDLIGVSRNINTNPKLLSQDFTELNVVDSTGNSFTYDKQKIGKNNVSFLYTEPMQNEISRSYLRFYARREPGQTQGLYVLSTSANYMGLVSSTDNSLPYANEAYQSFLSNNKNFHMQNAISYTQKGINMVGNMVSSAGKAAASAATGNAVGTVSSIIDAGSVAMNVGNFITDIAQKQLSIDNMKNAPSSLKNTNGNCLFNIATGTFGLWVEEYDAMDNDKAQLDDMMYLNGFAYDRLDNVRNYDNIRHYFNFVQANIESFNGVSMSNQIRDDLKLRFAQGVRFWNQDNIDYTMENYEKWLNNEE